MSKHETGWSYLHGGGQDLFKDIGVRNEDLSAGGFSI